MPVQIEQGGALRLQISFAHAKPNAYLPIVLTVPMNTGSLVVLSTMA